MLTVNSTEMVFLSSFLTVNNTATVSAGIAKKRPLTVKEIVKWIEDCAVGDSQEILMSGRAIRNNHPSTS